MLFQTKLFAPPATTPEAEMQQKMMKYMMVFMGVMFYKVPSGLGIYFITSSLWAIGERLLLPKVTHATEPDAGGKAASSQKGLPSLAGDSPNGDRAGSRGTSKPDPERNGDKDKPPGALAQFWSRVLEEARKDPTYRKVAGDRDDDEDRDKDETRDRPRPKPRRREETGSLPGPARRGFVRSSGSGRPRRALTDLAADGAGRVRREAMARSAPFRISRPAPQSNRSIPGYIARPFPDHDRMTLRHRP